MNNSKELHYLSASELVDLLAARKISSLELLDHTIARIEALDKKINAIPVRDFERARDYAKAADIAIAKGETNPLCGLPISVKEAFNVEGMPTSWCNPQFKNYYPAEDALVISRLKTAGAVIIGKSNIPFMLQDWQTYNDIYGVTNNPWNLNMTAGGSSGGSAAALAAGFVSLELGSDLAGSLRTPAHFCGVYAHKPTQDLLPISGIAPPTKISLPTGAELVVAGPMARSARDLELSLNILAGPDARRSGKAYKLALPKSRHKHLRDFRVLVLDTHPLYPTAASISKAINDLSDNLVKAGAKISRDAGKLPGHADITRMYAQFLGAHISSSLPLDIHQNYCMTASELKEEDQSLRAWFLRGLAATYREWLLAMRKREELRHDIHAVFNKFDVILCPVMPTPAFPHDHSDFLKREIEIDGRLNSYNDQYIWISIATLFGLPATVAPVAQTENGLPIGVQIIADYLEDYTSIQFANLLEREFAGLYPGMIQRV